MKASPITAYLLYSNAAKSSDVEGMLLKVKGGHEKPEPRGAFSNSPARGMTFSRRSGITGRLIKTHAEDSARRCSLMTYDAEAQEGIRPRDEATTHALI